MVDIEYDWYEIVRRYIVPGMLVLAIIGVLLWNMGGDSGGENIFRDMGSAMFNFGGGPLVAARLFIGVI